MSNFFVKIHFIFLFLLIITLLASDKIVANEYVKVRPLYYLKLGATQVPGEREEILPTLGIGARFQKEYYGVDVSANLSSMLFLSNYVSLKGMFLYYPQPHRRDQLYFGVGPGIGYRSVAILGCGPMVRGGSFEHGLLNLEGVVGYEFRYHHHFKPFIQLEISQPVCYLKDKLRHNFTPGLTVLLGIGF